MKQIKMQCIHCLARYLVVIVCFVGPVFADNAPRNQVIIISMDGVRWDFPDRGDFPGFKRMETDGVRVGKMLPTFPSNTFPGHVTLATGATPEKHGIINNRFYDTERKATLNKYEAASWLEAEPIWVTAERAGKKSAIYYWFGSDGAWQGIKPTYDKGRFETSLSEQDKVNQIISWMDLPEHNRPQLIMSYWHGVDTVGHKLGPDSGLIKTALAKQDAYLQQLLKAIDERKAWKHTTLMVVSDHGMTEKGNALSVQDIFKRADIPVWFQHTNAVAHIYLKDKTLKHQAIKRLKQFHGFETYFPDQMPEQISLNHKSRSGDLILVANDGFNFSEQGWLEQQTSKVISGGMHGYPASHPDMATIVFAMGKGVDHTKKIHQVEMIDVAPTLAALLGIEPPQHSRGKAFLPN